MEEINKLLEAIRFAKGVEDAAKKDRYAAEEALCALYAAEAPKEGAIKGEGFSITYKLTRKVDNDALFNAYDSLTPNAKKAFRFKAEVDLKQFRALSEMDEIGFATISDFVTTAPAKPTITLKD